MFGNTLGWILSAVTAVVMGGIMFLIAGAGSPTPPTGTLKIAMSPAVLPVNPDNVMPLPAKDCDSADLYRKAISEYSAHVDTYERYGNKVTEARDANPKAVEYVVEASDCGSMHLFDSRPDEVITYEERPSLDAIDKVGTLCNQIALLYATEKKADETRKYATAAFNLGRHLYAERLVFSEWSAGISMMQDACGALLKIETDPAKIDAEKSFMLDSEAYRRDKIQPLWQILSGIDRGQIIQYAGDIFVLSSAQNPERMWRVEAILKMGRYRYYSGTRGNLHAAKRQIAEMVKNEKDPTVKVAVQRASDLTDDEYQKL